MFLVTLEMCHKQTGIDTYLAASCGQHAGPIGQLILKESFRHINLDQSHPAHSKVFENNSEQSK